MHVDTTWKFKEMIAFRDKRAAELGLDLRISTNEEARAEGVSPFSHGTHEYTRIMKTVALRAGIDRYGFDAAIGGARRDEERSRAKERIFSLREPGHRWEPRKQRPEFWRTANTTLSEGQSMRVFPLSNWTELDVWRYIQRESIDIPSLYFAKERPVVERDGALIMVDDDRFPLRDGAVAQMRSVRFRTLGCYPLTGAVESTADNLADLIAEMESSTMSERAGRLIDGEGGGSMEAKKAEGYF
jgi:sulfate adenylyltransferase subunit 2